MRSAQSAGQASAPRWAPARRRREAGDGVGVARGAGGAAQGGDGLVDEEEEAEQAGRQGLLRDPALAGGPAGVGFRRDGAYGLLEAAQDLQALVPAARDEVLRGGVLGAGPQVAEPELVVAGAVLVGVGAQQADQAGRFGAFRQQPYGVRGEVGGGERGGVAVREGGLQLGGARALFVGEAGDEAYRGDAHVGAAALGVDLAGVLPGAVLTGQQLAGAQARVAGRAVVLRGAPPLHELLAHRAFQPLRAERPRTMAVRRPRPSARVICVSSVTIAGFGRSRERQSPYVARIEGTSLNSVGKPSASPRASPVSAPVAARLVTVVVVMRDVLPGRAGAGAGGGRRRCPRGRARRACPGRR